MEMFQRGGIREMDGQAEGSYTLRIATPRIRVRPLKCNYVPIFSWVEAVQYFNMGRLKT